MPLSRVPTRSRANSHLLILLQRAVAQVRAPVLLVREHHVLSPRACEQLVEVVYPECGAPCSCVFQTRARRASDLFRFDATDVGVGHALPLLTFEDPQLRSRLCPRVCERLLASLKRPHS